MLLTIFYCDGIFGCYIQSFNMIKEDTQMEMRITSIIPFGPLENILKVKYLTQAHHI
jgi:hypothetical protein